MDTSERNLRQLHQLHLRLKDASDKLERGPKQVAARHQVTERKKAELQERTDELTELRKKADAKGLQLKSNDSKISQLKVKLNTASSNREYDIFKSHIEADTMANSVLEDEILEILEKVDQLQVRCGELNQECETVLAEEQRVAQEVAAEEPGLRQAVTQLSAELGEAEQALPSSIAEDYRRLVHAHGAGALAPAQDGTCTECNFDLSPQSRVELNSGKILFCKNCGRLLYLPVD